jgi:hypothetical protein
MSVTLDQKTSWPAVAVILFVAYCFLDALRTWLEVRKQPGIPLVGAPFAFTPRFVPNLYYAHKAASILEDGYHKVCFSTP